MRTQTIDMHVCIRQHPATKAWYFKLLDSENQRAKQVTLKLWNKLKGSMYALAEGSGYNHIVIVGARDEGSTQENEHSALIRPDRVCSHTTRAPRCAL